VGEIRINEKFDTQTPHPSGLGVKVSVKLMVKLSTTLSDSVDMAALAAKTLPKATEPCWGSSRPRNTSITRKNDHMLEGHGTASHTKAETHIGSMAETEFAPIFTPFDTLVIGIFTWKMNVDNRLR
jgi:hypothetical protein